MKKRTRLIIFLLCIACFVLVAPVLVLYSEGYRIDFENMKITATGGIYVRTFPQANQITIDNGTALKLGIFSNSIFVQSLLPKDHTILVQKEGYFDYKKTLAVREKEVTKAENVFLFKKDIKFDILADGIRPPFENQEKFALKNADLYYSDAEENVALGATEKKTPVIKNILAFAETGNTVVWLGVDGFLYESAINGRNAETIKLIKEPIEIIKKGLYKITATGQITLLSSSDALFLLDRKEGVLTKIADNADGARISPDKKNILYFDSSNIYLYSLEQKEETKGGRLLKLNEAVRDVEWINNDYFVFSAGNKIIISEIDDRDTLNTMQIANNIYAEELLFNRQEGKLYILTKKEILVSEKITP